MPPAVPVGRTAPPAVPVDRTAPRALAGVGVGGRRLRGDRRGDAGRAGDAHGRTRAVALTAGGTPGRLRRPEVTERGARLGDADRLHGAVVPHLRPAPGAFGQLPHRGQVHRIGAGDLGERDDRALGREQPAAQVTLPGRLAVPGAVGERRDAQAATVHEPSYLAGELLDLRVQFLGQVFPARHLFPPLPPGSVLLFPAPGPPARPAFRYPCWLPTGMRCLRIPVPGVGAHGSMCGRGHAPSATGSS